MAVLLKWVQANVLKPPYASGSQQASITDLGAGEGLDLPQKVVQRWRDDQRKNDPKWYDDWLRRWLAVWQQEEREAPDNEDIRKRDMRRLRIARSQISLGEAPRQVFLRFFGTLVHAEAQRDWPLVKNANKPPRKAARIPKPVVEPKWPWPAAAVGSMAVVLLVLGLRFFFSRRHCYNAILEACRVTEPPDWQH
ncbi:MAG: hypothetical protein AAF449_12405, partial [Myxococcota bacterium]